jgi:hypothetical protein
LCARPAALRRSQRPRRCSTRRSTPGETRDSFRSGRTERLFAPVHAPALNAAVDDTARICCQAIRIP